MKKYILSLDEGTTSARAILFNKNAEIVSMSQHEIPQIFPAPGMVEQNPMDIYGNQYAAMSECIAKSGINPEEIAGIGITNQRETVIAWNKNTGRPFATPLFGNAAAQRISAESWRMRAILNILWKQQDLELTHISAELKLNGF